MDDIARFGAHPARLDVRGRFARGSGTMFRPPCRVPFQLPGLSAAVCRNVLFPSLPVISIFGQIQRKLYSKRKILSRKTACGQNDGIATGGSNHE